MYGLRGNLLDNFVVIGNPLTSASIIAFGSLPGSCVRGNRMQQIDAAISNCIFFIHNFFSSTRVIFPPFNKYQSWSLFYRSADFYRESDFILKYLVKGSRDAVSFISNRKFWLPDESERL